MAALAQLGAQVTTLMEDATWAASANAAIKQRLDAEGEAVVGRLRAASEQHAEELRRSLPQLKNDVAQAMTQGTAAMLACAESWGSELVARVASEVDQRTADLTGGFRAHGDLCVTEMATLVGQLQERAQQQKQDAVRGAATHAERSREESAKALRTAMGGAKREMQVHVEKGTHQLEELKARNAELEVQLSVTQAQIVAATRRTEAAKEQGEESLRYAEVGRRALEVQLARVERELQNEKKGRLALLSRKQAAACLWGRAADGVFSGALAATVEAPQPALVVEIEAVEEVEVVEQQQPEEEEEEEEQVQQLDELPSPASVTELDIITTPEAASTPTLLASSGRRRSSTAANISPLFESPGIPTATPTPTNAPTNTKRPDEEDSSARRARPEKTEKTIASRRKASERAATTSERKAPRPRPASATVSKSKSASTGVKPRQRPSSALSARQAGASASAGKVSMTVNCLPLLELANVFAVFARGLWGGLPSCAGRLQVTQDSGQSRARLTRLGRH